MRRALLAATVAAVVLAAGAASAQRVQYGPGTAASVGAMSQDGSNATAGTTQTNLGIVRPNILINGAMQVDLANEGASVAVNSGGNTFVADVWKTNFSDSSTGNTVQRIASTAFGGQYTLKFTLGTASGSVTAAQFANIAQWLEGIQLVDLAYSTANAKTITFTVPIKSSVSGTIAVSWSNGARTRTYFKNCAVTANTAATCTITIPGDTTAGWTLTGTAVQGILQIVLACGSNFQGTEATWTAGDIRCTSGQTQFTTQANGSTFEIGNVKMEIGSSATPFVALPIDQELLRVNRRYAKTFPQGTAPAQSAGLAGALCGKAASATAGTLSQLWRFPVEMRASPTITTFNPSAANANWRNVAGAADAVVQVDPSTAKGTTAVEIAEQTTALTAANDYCIHATADSRL